MPRARFTQAEIQRLIKAAKAEGVVVEAVAAVVDGNVLRIETVGGKVAQAHDPPKVPRDGVRTTLLRRWHRRWTYSAPFSPPAARRTPTDMAQRTTEALGLGQIRRARERAAQMLVLDDAYAPIFERLDQECEALASAEGADVIERARARIKAQRVKA